MKSTILQQLGTFGLSRAEARIYVTLSGGQPQSVLDIARALELPRTNVYDALTKLAERGLIERIIKHKRTQYKAAPVSALETIIRERKSVVDSMESSFVAIQKELEKPALISHETEVRYYKGAQGLRQMMWNSLKADESGIVGYSTFGRVEVVGLEFYQRYTAAFEKRKIKDRVIINPTKQTLVRIVEDVKPEKHHMNPMNIRVLPTESIRIAGDTMIYNTIYAMCYWEGGEVVGVEIESPDFVHTQRTMFEFLWKQAIELEKTKL